MTSRSQRLLFPAEKNEQAALVHWLTIMNIPYVAHMTGVNLYGNWALINSLKQTGQLQKGVPDIFIPVPAGGYHGLWIEMKREVGGVLSCEQRKWLDRLNADGYRAIVAKGADAAVEQIKEYLGGTHEEGRAA